MSLPELPPPAAGFPPDPRLPLGAVRYRVGGAVRDRLLGRPVSETDWLITGTTPEAMRAAGFLPVGADFPVFLHPESKEEYALARTERKSGRGYHGFTFHADAGVTVAADLSRRDLTVNAIAEDADGRLVDPFGGAADVAARVLRHVGPAFAEDPVRILRLARFAARFAPLGFTVAAETMDLCRAMVADGEADHLVPERVWKEASRALMEPAPAVFFETLRAVGALARLMPELDALWGVPQPPRHHPEIDTGAHTMLVLARAAELGGDLDARWAALCHDLGKALTAPAEWPHHHGHEARGVAPTEALSARLKVPNAARTLAVLVCRDHLHVHRVGELAPKTLHDLLERLDAFRPPATSRFARALLACQADMQGRLGFAERPYPQAAFVAQAREVAVALSAREVVADGFQGAAIGTELRRRRIGALRAWKKAQGLVVAGDDPEERDG